MSDPTIPVIVGVGAGLGSVTAAVLGVEPQALVLAVIGCGIGIGFAPRSGRVRAVLLFVAVVAACAVLGTWAAAQWFGASPLARNGISLILGIAFHPLLGVMIARIPSTFDALLGRLGLK